MASFEGWNCGQGGGSTLFWAQSGSQRQTQTYQKMADAHASTSALAVEPTVPKDEPD